MWRCRRKKRQFLPLPEACRPTNRLLHLPARQVRRRARAVPLDAFVREERDLDAASAAEDQDVSLEIDDALEPPQLVETEQQELVLHLQHRKVHRVLHALPQEDGDAPELPEDPRAAHARRDALLRPVEAVQQAQRARER